MRGQHRTYEECLASAKLYPTAQAWKLGDYTTFHYAYYHGWHPKIKQLLGWPLNYSREYEDSKSNASMFANLTAWHEGDTSSYAYAYRRGWHRKIAEDLNWPLYRKIDEGRWESKKLKKN